jgi:hypothetical protein
MPVVVQELPGVEVLAGTTAALAPGEAFRPTDPFDEAHAQRVPSGLLHTVEEDVDGLEDEHAFAPPTLHRPVTAIDAGVVKLGNTPDGVVGAVRAAAVTRFPDGRLQLRTYRPGLFTFNSKNRLGIFHAMGEALGKADFFVRVAGGNPKEEKVRLGVHDHRLLDRARNYIERLVQRQICEELSDSDIAIDGALTLRTYDTPQVFLHQLHDVCQDHDLSLVAVAKKTGLAVRGVDIRLLLDREGGLPGRRRLTAAVRAEQKDGAHRALGDLYVARFAPGGDTYRVDVDPAPGLTSAAALDAFAAACLHRNGYPEPLLQAHAFSYMPPPVVAELQADAVARHRLVVKPEPNLGPVFAPFGGRWK